MADIIIKNVEDLKNYCDSILADLETEDTVDLSQFQDGLKLHIEGDRYHSTLDTSLMEYFVTFQKNINDIYSIKKHGKIQALTAEEKEQLLVYVGVRPGSSLAEIKNFFDILVMITGGELKMTTGTITMLAIGAVVAAGTVGYKAWAHKNRIKIEQAKIELEKKRIDAEDRRAQIAYQEKKQLVDTIGRMFDTGIKNNTKMFRALAAPVDAKINMNGKDIPHEILKSESENEKDPQPLSNINLDGLFEVLEITFDYKVDTSFATVRFVQTGEVYKDVNLQDCYLSPEKLAFIKDAEKKAPIELSINIDKKGDKVTRAYVNLDRYGKTGPTAK